MKGLGLCKAGRVILGKINVYIHTSVKSISSIWVVYNSLDVRQKHSLDELQKRSKNLYNFIKNVEKLKIYQVQRPGPCHQDYIT